MPAVQPCCQQVSAVQRCKVLPARTKLIRTLSLRGRRSRNKVSIGEPAEGSFMNQKLYWWFPPARGVSVPLNSGDHCKLSFFGKKLSNRGRKSFRLVFTRRAFLRRALRRAGSFFLFRFLTKHLKHLLNKKQPATTERPCAV
jgi:hypothetical protein